MVSIPFAEITAQCKFEEGRVAVVSHRGDWRNAPENSIMAIENCIEMGVNMVEIDLKKTKDNQLILLHDNTLDRTTNGKGKPSDYTLAQIKKLRLKNGLGRVTLHKIPTLEEALMVAKGKIWINIDKGYDYFDEVEKILEKTGTIKQVMIKSDKTCETVQKEHPTILRDLFYMPIVFADKPGAMTFVKEYVETIHPLAFEVCFQTITPEVIKVIDYIKESKCHIWINTLWSSLCAGLDDDRAVVLNEKEQTWGEVIRIGASFIQTDRPKELIDYLKKNELLINQEPAAQIRKHLLERNINYVSVVSHRGDWKTYPENSLEAIKSIIDMKGDIVEIDVQRTKDGQYILMHDETVDRTTNGKGIIAEMTFSEIQKLRLKDSKGNVTGYRIPTLEEALLLSKGKIMLNLDKAERFFDGVMSVVIKHDMVDYVIMKGDFSLKELYAKYGIYMDRLIYMPKFRLDEKGAYEKLVGFVKDMRPVIFEIGYKTDENKLPLDVKKITEKVSLLWYNSLAGRNGGHDDVVSLEDPQKGYGYLIDVLGARLIQTDEPLYLLNYLRKRNLHD